MQTIKILFYIKFIDNSNSVQFFYVHSIFVHPIKLKSFGFISIENILNPFQPFIHKNLGEKICIKSNNDDSFFVQFSGDGNE